MSKNSIYLLVSQFLGQQNNISVPVPLVRITGDYTAAAFVSQCVYWSDRTTDGDGWFHKTHEEWAGEMHLTSDQVRRCVKSSGGIIEVKRAGVPARNYYRVNRELLVERLQDLAAGSTEDQNVTTSSNGETQQLEVGKPNNKPQANPTASRSADPTSNKGTKTTSKTTTKIGGEYNITGDARVTQQPTAPVVEPSPAPFTTTDASLQKEVKAVREASASVAVLPPDGGAADAAAEKPVNPSPVQSVAQDAGHAHATSSEDVPGAAASLDLEELLTFAPHDPEETRQVLMRALGGMKKFGELLDETPPGLNDGDRRLWLAQISPERAQELITQARANKTMHPWTAITQLLDQEIGARIIRGTGPTQTATANAGSHAEAQHIAPQDYSGDQGKYQPGAIWVEKATGKEYRMVGLETTTNKAAGAGARYRFDDNTVVPALVLMTKYEFRVA